MEESKQKNNSPTKEEAYSTPFVVDLYDMQDQGRIAAYFEKVNSMPSSIKKILTDFSTAEFVEEKLGPTFGLSTKQKKDTLRIIRDTLLGNIFGGDMVKNFVSKLEIDQNTAEKIKTALVSDLFKSAAEDIKKGQMKIFSDKIAPASPPFQQNQKLQDTNQSNTVDLRNK